MKWSGSTKSSSSDKVTYYVGNHIDGGGWNWFSACLKCYSFLSMINVLGVDILIFEPVGKDVL